ncbi:MAG: hypothetical protein C4551_06455 [Bacillota bacterium]|nr:MAG: hypothetical protein C4551_06455 [Bacillota bacterium]
MSGFDLLFALVVFVAALGFVAWREREREQVFRVEREAWTRERADLLSRLMAQDWSLYTQGLIAQRPPNTTTAQALTDEEEAILEQRRLEAMRRG